MSITLDLVEGTHMGINLTPLGKEFQQPQRWVSTLENRFGTYNYNNYHC